MLLLSGLPEMVQEVIGQCDPNLGGVRSCRSDEYDQCGSIGTLFRDERGTFPVPPATESPGEESAKDSILDSRTSERSNQVIIDLNEAQPSGKSHLSVVGVPGFPGLILGPSASTGVHDRPSLSWQFGEGLAIHSESSTGNRVYL